MISMLDPRVIVIVVGLAAARQGPESLGLGIRGVPLWDTPRWASFSCDGRPMDGAVVNDDHCDCADASDEPGTAACASALDRAEAARARFYCGAGAGYQSAKLRMHLRRPAGQIQRADRVSVNDVTQQLDQLVRQGLGAGWPGIDVAVQAPLVAAVGQIYL